MTCLHFYFWLYLLVFNEVTIPSWLYSRDVTLKLAPAFICFSIAMIILAANLASQKEKWKRSDPETSNRLASLAAC